MFHPSFLCFTDPIPFLAGRNRRRPGGSKQPAVCLLGLRASVPVIVVVDLHPICGDADAVFGQKSCVFATELNCGGAPSSIVMIFSDRVSQRGLRRRDLPHIAERGTGGRRPAVEDAQVAPGAGGLGRFGLARAATRATRAAR
jgi:hypothetical protein